MFWQVVVLVGSKYKWLQFCMLAYSILSGSHNLTVFQSTSGPGINLRRSSINPCAFLVSYMIYDQYLLYVYIQSIRMPVYGFVWSLHLIGVNVIIASNALSWCRYTTIKRLQGEQEEFTYRRRGKTFIQILRSNHINKIHGLPTII